MPKLPDEPALLFEGIENGHVWVRKARDIASGVFCRVCEITSTGRGESATPCRSGVYTKAEVRHIVTNVREQVKLEVLTSLERVLQERREIDAEPRTLRDFRVLLTDLKSAIERTVIIE